MIIADTSVWVEHFRRRDTALGRLLVDSIVVLHPFVLGELLLHGLPKRGGLAAALIELDQAPLATPSEAAAFITWAKLAGTGVGYVDVHLIISARMLPNGRILTLDSDLQTQAERLGVAYAP